MRQLYDYIGIGYAKRRRPDPRIATEIKNALSTAKTVVNVGAGTGSYEPQDRIVVAVEPSREMIRQRPPGSTFVVQGSASVLPFADAAFDAALAVLTIHHWPDRRQGLRELARVARERIVIVTCDLESSGFWLVEDYFPEILEIDRRTMPTMDELRDVLGDIRIQPLPVPHDCVDGFLGAYWRRPQAYLDPQVRRAISSFSKLQDVTPGLTQLQNDLADGTWQRRHGKLHLGYRLVLGGNK
jgi:SAM-dependent methyltransferase